MARRELTAKDKEDLANLFLKNPGDLGELLPKYMLLREKTLELAEFYLRNVTSDDQAQRGLTLLSFTFTNLWAECAFTAES